ncbi:MAG: M20 metallopeptidase family protein [Fusobacteriaceae bacterium]
MEHIDILNFSKNLFQWLKNVREEFHQFPELGMEEFETSERIIKYLSQMGIKNIKKVAGTGIVAYISGSDPSITVALRADIDALPIEDMKVFSYSSKTKGLCHACGHDAHTTILLGVAKFFYDTGNPPPCNLRLIFQPAEETVGGAQPMISEGVLQGVDYIFGLHVDDTLESGMIGYKYGAMNASSDTLDITIKGKSCHGAYPSEGTDAILIASDLILSLQSVVSRNIDARESGVITIGTISGGTQGNIIADNVHMRGTLRTLNPKVRRDMLERIGNMVVTLPLAFGGEGKFVREEGYTSLINHDSAVDIVVENGKKILGENALYEKKVPNMGVEDFAYFLEKVPGAFFTLGTRNEAKGITAPAHNGMFDIDPDSLPLGVALQVSNIFSTHQKLKKKK